jgi:Lon protease-like protein
MADDLSIEINFAKPVPLFPLDGVVLLPQQVAPLHIFEPRYRQMVAQALDSSGLIAMAVYAAAPQRSTPRPPLRQAVCVGQLVEHEKLADGCYNIMLLGVCRARIAAELPPAPDRLYRLAHLEPLDPYGDDETDLSSVRSELERMFATRGLRSLVSSQRILEGIADEGVSDQLLLEWITLSLISDHRLRYRLLAEGNASTRASMILAELRHLDRLIRLARSQHPERWPKGTSWN